MTAELSKGPAKGFAAFLKRLTGMADRVSHQVATALDEESATRQPCPISTAVEFGLRVQRRPRDDGKKIIY